MILSKIGSMDLLFFVFLRFQLEKVDLSVSFFHVCSQTLITDATKVCSLDININITRGHNAEAGLARYRSSKRSYSGPSHYHDDSERPPSTFFGMPLSDMKKTFTIQEGEE